MTSDPSDQHGAASHDQVKAHLTGLFETAVKAADPSHCLPAHLPSPPKGRTVVIGAGKAAASMARAVEQHWQGDLSGIVVTRYDHGVACDRIEVIEAAHPVPDEKGIDAAARILESVRNLTADDLVLFLASGGGSALLTMPAAGISLGDKQDLNRALLRSGANITEMNTVRKHLSAIKGGRLALAAAPAQVVTLAISDVPGDDPAVIASGPTVGDASTIADAIAVLEKYDITPAPSIQDALSEAAAETPFPGDPALAHSNFRMIATPMGALEAVKSELLDGADGGVRAAVHILGDALEGEARELAAEHAGLSTRVTALPHNGTTPPSYFISGGETTVTVKGNGRGGRNAEYLLALAIALDGHPHVHAIACDTDGIDGSEDNAGAYIGPDTLQRARELGLDAQAMLDNNDGYSFFKALGDLIMTGPTLTNINDFRAMVVQQPSPPRTRA